MDKKLDCSIVTPDNLVYQGKCDCVIVPSVCGEVGFLFNHTPIIVQLGVGEARVIGDRYVEHFFIEQGVAEVRNNAVSILAEAAVNARDFDLSALEKEYDSLMQQKKKGKRDEELLKRIFIVSTQLKIINHAENER